MHKLIHHSSVGRFCLSALVCVAVAAPFVSCSGESQASLTAAKVTTGKVTYSDVAPICHIGGGTGPELGGYSNFKTSADDAMRAIKDGSMPPGGPALPADEVSLLQAWIDQGKLK